MLMNVSALYGLMLTHDETKCNTYFLKFVYGGYKSIEKNMQKKYKMELEKKDGNVY